MRIVRVLSVIALAAYLSLHGLLNVAELSAPWLSSTIGFLGLAAGVLMFISLSHWTNLHAED